MRYRNTGKLSEYCSASRQTVSSGGSSCEVDSLVMLLRQLTDVSPSMQIVLSDEERRLMGRMIEQDSRARRISSREMDAAIRMLKGVAPKPAPLPQPPSRKEASAARDLEELRALAAAEDRKVAAVRAAEARERQIMAEANAVASDGVVMDTHNMVKAVEGRLNPHVVDGVPTDFREAMEHNMAVPKAENRRRDAAPAKAAGIEKPAPSDRPMTPSQIERHLETQHRMNRKDDFVVASKDPRIIPGMPVVPGFDITKEDFGSSPRYGRSNNMTGKAGR